MKKNWILGLCVLSVFFTFGCDKLDYNSAEKAYENGQYEVAAEKFAELGDYADSQQMLKFATNKRTDELLKEKAYKDAVDFVKLYPERVNYEWFLETTITESISGMKSLGQYDDALAFLEEYKDDCSDYDAISADIIAAKENAEIKAEMEKIYAQAKNYFESGSVEKGVAILKTLPEDYGNVSQILSDYEIIQPFCGEWRTVSNSYGSTYNMEINIYPELSGNGLKMSSHHYVKAQDDGYIWVQNHFLLSSNEIENNYIIFESENGGKKYSYKISGKKLIVTDAGSKLTYSKK